MKLIEKFKKSIPNLKEKVGGSIPNYEISSLLVRNVPGGQLPLVLWRWLVDLVSQKKKKEEKLKANMTESTT